MAVNELENIKKEAIKKICRAPSVPSLPPNFPNGVESFFPFVDLMDISEGVEFAIKKTVELKDKECKKEHGD